MLTRLLILLTLWMGSLKVSAQDADSINKASHQTLIHACSPSVYQPHESAAAILQTEELTEVEFQHLTAPILDVGQEG